MAGGRESPVPVGLVAQIAGLLGGVASNARSLVQGYLEWFGPGTPPERDAPTQQERRFDYPEHVNMRVTPRDFEGVSFEQLRGLAQFDILRLAIETRKDQLARLSWEIRRRRDKSRQDSRIEKIEDHLQYPDRENPFDTWLRMLCEDLLVIDAPVIFPRLTRGGEPYALELIDGATIVRRIDDKGRTPQPEAPYPHNIAYQQVIKGMVAADFTRDQLWYLARNLRTNRLYGYSPVEQVIVTINTALRRQLSTLQYYTEGNIPEAIANVPETWTLDQIIRFQEYWDAVLEGNTAQRRHMKFIPGGVKYTPTKEPDLKAEFDEWIARVVCYAFSLPPTPFIRQMNRATAESSQDAALAEGLEPLKLYIKGIMDRALRFFYRAPELEFAWRFEASLNRLDQAQIHRVYVDSGVLTRDEARAEIGYPKLTEEQKREIEEAQTKPLNRDEGVSKPKRADPKNSTA